MIDDVWSGGRASDGLYTLMSSAIAAGLYHVNCKDTHTTFSPGISDAPDDTWTPAELEDVQMFNETEARQQWKKQLSDNQEYRPIVRGDSKIIEVEPDKKVDVKKINSYKENIYVSDNEVIKPRALHEIYTNTVRALKKWDISKDRMPEIRILSKEELKAYGKYDAVNNVVYYISEIVNKEIVGQKGVTEYHEMWHMKQAEKFRSKGWNITKENYGKYIRELNKECKKTIDTLGINKYYVDKISDYAKKMFEYGRYDEVEAEYMTIIKSKGERTMIVDYPDEIKKLMKKYEPYADKIKDGELKDAPQEAIDAFYKCKEWAWEQGQ